MKYLLCILSIVLSIKLHALEIEHGNEINVVITVSDVLEGSVYSKAASDSFKKKLCNNIFNISQQVANQKINLYCQSVSTNEIMTSKIPEELLNKAQFRFFVTRTSTDLIIDYQNLKISRNPKLKENDVERFQWKIKQSDPSKSSEVKDLFVKIFSNSFQYISNEDQFKSLLMLNAVALQESQLIKFDLNKNALIDQRTGEEVSVKKATQIVSDEGQKNKNFFRAGVELGLILSISQVGYYLKHDFNAVDFDYNTLASAMKAKFVTGDGIRFDDNAVGTNVGHEWAGYAYHNIIRSNGATSLEALLFDLGASVAWEILEYREVFSINDIIMTALGGFVLGESLFQTACALQSKNNPISKALGGIAQPGIVVNQMLSHSAKDRKNNNCKTPNWSEISAYIGVSNIKSSFDGVNYKSPTYGMNSKIVNIEGFNKEGFGKGYIIDSALSEISVEMDMEDDLDLAAKVALAAWYQNDMQVDSMGRLSGYNIIFAATTGTNLHQVNNDKDVYNTVNILGSTVLVNLQKYGYQLMAEFEIHGDFAMVKSLAAIPFASNGGNMINQQSSLIKNGYYWGYGLSKALRIELKNGLYSFGGKVETSESRDIKGRDRYATIEMSDLNDSRKYLNAYLKFKLAKYVSFRLSFDRVLRTSQVDSTKIKKSELKYTGNLEFLF